MRVQLKADGYIFGSLTVIGSASMQLKASCSLNEG